METKSAPDPRLLNTFTEMAQKSENTQQQNLLLAASKMADAIEQDRLIYI